MRRTIGPPLPTAVRKWTSCPLGPPSGRGAASRTTLPASSRTTSQETPSREYRAAAAFFSAATRGLSASSGSSDSGGTRSRANEGGALVVALQQGEWGVVILAIRPLGLVAGREDGDDARPLLGQLQLEQVSLGLLDRPGPQHQLRRLDRGDAVPLGDRAGAPRGRASPCPCRRRRHSRASPARRGRPGGDGVGLGLLGRGLGGRQSQLLHHDRHPGDEDERQEEEEDQPPLLVAHGRGGLARWGRSFGRGGGGDGSGGVSGPAGVDRRGRARVRGWRRSCGSSPRSRRRGGDRSGASAPCRPPSRRGRPACRRGRRRG